ncbi:MAG TPA: hypothetical protein VK906_18705 [Egicoccus sp.]|nr:hypothetical protein [Egicoccus sp.]HSK25225.1 hypothetical protein [Egicoccus sp.]
MQASSRRIRRTVRGARNHWSRLGVPRDVRDRLAADLRAELEDAAARDLPVEFVVGDDLAAFATTRAPREGRRSLASFVGELLIGVVLVPPGLALLTSVFNDRPVGFHVHELVWVLGVVLGSAWLQALHERREFLDHATWLRLGLAGVVLFAAGGFAFSSALRTPARFVEVAPGLAWGVIGVTVLGQLVVSRQRRARWRESVDASA